MDNNLKPEKNDIKTRLFFVIGTIVLICGVAFLAIMFIGSLIAKSYLSSAIIFALMIFLIPPVYHKIPKFRGKHVVSAILVFVGFAIAMAVVEPTPPSAKGDGETAANVGPKEDEESELVEESEQEKPAEIVEEVETSSVEETEEEDDWRTQYREYMDSLSLQDWITENIEEGAKGSEYDWDGIERRSKEIAIDEFFNEWCASVGGSLKYAHDIGNIDVRTSPDEVADYCDYLESAMWFFDDMYPDNELINATIKPLIEETVSLGRETISYVYNAPNYSSEVFHIQNRYDKTSTYTMWVAYGTYMDDYLDTYVDWDSGIKAILRTTIENPFPASAKYRIQYTDSGETEYIETNSGFSSNVPIYDIVSIGNENNDSLSNNGEYFSTWLEFSSKWQEIQNYFDINDN